MERTEVEGKIIWENLLGEQVEHDLKVHFDPETGEIYEYY